MSTELEEKPSTALTVIERAALALGADEHEKELVALSKKYKDIVEIKNPAGRQQCHAAAMELSNARIATTKTGETAREDANAFQKAVIAEVKRRIAIISAEETRLLALRDTWDKEREAEKIAKALAESQRITAIRQKIDAMRNAPQQWINKPSAEIGVAADHLSETVIALDDFQEYTGEAQSERDAAVKQLRAMQEAMRVHEEAQAALEVERATLARERASADERERVAAAEREAQSRKDAAARAEQEARDRKERARVAAEQAEAAEKAAAVLLAERVAHDALMEAQQEELNRKQALVDAAIAEQGRIAREAREAAAAREWAEQQDREREARIEAQRIQSVKDAEEAAERVEAARLFMAQQDAEAEKARRERVQFELNGPEASEMVAILAAHYEVEQQTVLNWINLHVWADVEVVA